MNERSDMNRVLRHWFDDGPTSMPDRVVDVVADRISRQPQRRSWRLLGRLRPMNRTLLYGSALAAAIVVAVVGYNLLPSPPTSGGPESPAPSPRPSPTATAEAACVGVVDIPDAETALPPCRYRFHPYEDVPTLSVVADVPAGWRGQGQLGIDVPRGIRAPNGLAVLFQKTSAGIYSDPCHWDVDGTGTWDQPGDVAVGPTVQDLVDALRAQTAYTSSTPRPVSFGDVDGQELEIQLPADLNLETCDRDPDGGGARYRVFPETIYAQGDGNRWRMSIVDVAGTRAIVMVVYYPGTPAADVQVAEAIVNSLVFTP